MAVCATRVGSREADAVWSSGGFKQKRDVLDIFRLFRHSVCSWLVHVRSCWLFVSSPAHGTSIPAATCGSRFYQQSVPAKGIETGQAMTSQVTSCSLKCWGNNETLIQIPSYSQLFHGNFVCVHSGCRA